MTEIRLLPCKICNIFICFVAILFILFIYLHYLSIYLFIFTDVHLLLIISEVSHLILYLNISRTSTKQELSKEKIAIKILQRR